MLRIYRRHEKRCSLKSKAEANCPGKVKCPVWVTGTLQDGTTVKPKSLNTRNWAVAAQQALEMEAGVKPETPKVTIGEAIASYQQFKEKRSDDTKRKIKLLTGRLAAFLDKRSVFKVADVKLPDLVAFRDTWTGEASTRRRDQEILKSFFWYCFNADFLVKNPVVHLDPITVERSKTDPFTVEEQVAIFDALPDFPDEYGRRGLPIAIQTKAFVLVLRYTGMAIGDVAKLDKQSVHGRRIVTNRKKTGEEVFASVPQFVIDALKEAPHDSDRYFFWSGQGKIHTRTSKWGSRLKKLFILADVLTTTVDKRRRVAGKLTDETEAVKISMAHPYMFRHTFARDFLETGGSMAELAELLGNTEAICQKHYSKWDKRRQDRLERNIDAMRADDLITKMMNKVA